MVKLVGAENSVTIADVRVPPRHAPYVNIDLNAFKKCDSAVERVQNHDESLSRFRGQEGRSRPVAELWHPTRISGTHTRKNQFVA